MKSPAFRFYPADFMGSPDVQAMDLDEVGGYLFLLCMAWQSDRHGYLPDDEGKLRRWAKMTHEQWEQSREILLSKFPVAEPGWRCNPRMALEADKQAVFAESQKRKADKRWGRAEDKQQDSPTDAPAYAPALKVDARGMPSVSVSVSDEKQEQKQPATAPQSPGVLALVPSEKPKVVNMPQKADEVWAAEIWKLWPSTVERSTGKEKVRRGARHGGIKQIMRAIAELRLEGAPDAGLELYTRTRTWLTWYLAEAGHRWIENLPHVSTWFGASDKGKRYNDDEAQPTPESEVTLADGKRIREAELKAQGWGVEAAS